MFFYNKSLSLAFNSTKFLLFKQRLIHLLRVTNLKTFDKKSILNGQKMSGHSK